MAENELKSATDLNPKFFENFRTIFQVNIKNILIYV